MVSPSDAPLDRDALFERAGGDWDLIASLADIFESQEAAMFQALDDACVAADPAAVARAAHGMASSLGTMGATDAFRAAKSLELTAKTDGMVGVVAARQRLQDTYAPFREALTAIALESHARIAEGG